MTRAAVIRRAVVFVLGAALPLASARAQRPQPFSASDLRLIRTVSDVQLSPSGSQALITVTRSESPGRPTSEVQLVTLASGASRRLGRNGEGVSGVRWSPAGDRLA